MFDKLGGEAVTFVKAVMHFFAEGEYGRKIEISEFQQLTQEDKVDLREMLIAEGYNVQALATS